jgi:hypothetical protein
MKCCCAAMVFNSLNGRAYALPTHPDALIGLKPEGIDAEKPGTLAGVGACRASS